MRIFPWSDEDAARSDGRPPDRDRFLATVDVCTVRRSRLVRVTRVDIERPRVHAIPALPDHLGAQPVPEGHDLFGLRLACVLGGRRRGPGTPGCTCGCASKTGG